MYLKLGVLVCQMKILKRVLARTTEIMNEQDHRHDRNC